VSNHVVVIGAGVVGAASAIELLNDGRRATLLESAEPGGEQAASYWNAGWFSSHSVIPSAGPRTPMLAADCKAVASVTETALRMAGQVEIAAADAAPNRRRADALRTHLPRDLSPDRIRYWLGCRPRMPDGLPCIGFASATRHIIHAFGHGHAGLVGSARTERVVAQLLSGRDPEIPLGPFDPRRFA